jgi:hypothetical protein
MTAFAAAAAPLANAFSGRAGAYCVLTAWVLCTTTGGVVLLLRETYPHPRFLLPHLMADFVLRMGAPLAICMLVYMRGGTFVEAGFVFYLLGFYFLSLAAGTLFALPRPLAPPSGKCG